MKVIKQIIKKIKLIATSLIGEFKGQSKKRIVRIALKFLALVIVFTILSRVAYNVTLTQVTVANAESGTIVHQVSGSGEVKAKQELAAGTNLEGLVIKTIYVKEGETVKKNAKLYKLDEDALNEIISQKQTEINMINLQIKEMSNQTDEEGKAVEGTVSPETKLEKETKSKELGKYLELKNKDGIIRAPKKGIVSVVNAVPGGSPTSSDIIYADISSGVFLEAQFSIDDKDYIKKGASAEIIGGSAGNDKGDLKVSAVRESQEDPNILNVTIPLGDDSYDAGEQLDVIIKSKSETTGICVPREALHEDSSGGSYVYITEEVETVLGTQYTASKLGVDVLDKDDINAALEGIEYEQVVIIHSTRDLEDKMKIKITEGLSNEEDTELE